MRLPHDSMGGSLTLAIILTAVLFVLVRMFVNSAPL